MLPAKDVRSRKQIIMVELWAVLTLVRLEKKCTRLTFFIPSRLDCCGEREKNRVCGCVSVCLCVEDVCPLKYPSTVGNGSSWSQNHPFFLQLKHTCGYVQSFFSGKWKGETYAWAHLYMYIFPLLKKISRLSSIKFFRRTGWSWWWHRCSFFPAGKRERERDQPD